MPTKVEIEYCHPCGHLERAIDTQRVILTEFGRTLESVTLVTGSGGVFKIRVNGEQIFDKKGGDAYDEQAILAAIKQRVS